MTGSDVAVARVDCSTSKRSLRAPFRTALREVTELEVVVVRVGWSDGTATAAAVSPTPPITGETVGSIVAAASGPLAAAVAGVPLDEHELLFRRLAAAMRGNTTAKCAVDLAVHTALAGRLGGLTAYLGAWLRPLHTDVTVSLATPEKMAEEARGRVEDGFDLLKLKVGGPDPGGDVARVRAVADAVGPTIGLRLDANQAWNAKGALAVLDGLERVGIRPELVEQPVAAHDLAGMAAVTRYGSVPVLADESVHSAHDVVRVAEAGAADMVNVKLAKCGGLRAARDVVAAAEACGLGVVVGSMLEPAGTVAAAVALALTLPDRRAHDLDASWWSGSTDVEVRPPTVQLA